MAFVNTDLPMFFHLIKGKTAMHTTPSFPFAYYVKQRLFRFFNTSIKIKQAKCILYQNFKLPTDRTK